MRVAVIFLGLAIAAAACFGLLYPLLFPPLTFGPEETSSVQDEGDRERIINALSGMVPEEDLSKFNRDALRHQALAVAEEAVRRMKKLRDDLTVQRQGRQAPRVVQAVLTDWIETRNRYRRDRPNRQFSSRRRSA